MALIAKNGVTYVVVMRHLHIVEQNDVLQLHRITDNAVCAYECGTSYKSTVTNLRLRADDTWCTEIRAREYLRRLMHPDALCALFVLIDR